MIKMVNPVGEPFEFPYLIDGSNILSVILPTFIDVIFLSPDVELCPSAYRNWAQAELPGQCQRQTRIRLKEAGK